MHTALASYGPAGIVVPARVLGASLAAGLLPASTVYILGASDRTVVHFGPRSPAGWPSQGAAGVFGEFV